MNSDGEDEGYASRLKQLVRRALHGSHSVSEVFHLGYFATAAGLMHEFHSLFAGACGVLLLVALVLNAGGSEA